MGTLYLVATPIGNLEDITLRALKTLQSVDLIAAEDTRTTRALLNHYGIHTPLTSHHRLNERAKCSTLLDQLQTQDIAIVSDAGTPLINDPGYILAQAAEEQGIPVIAIPGPSSPVVALSLSGLPTDQFMFMGYLPRKASDRHACLKSVSTYPMTLICLETPHRLRASLDDMLIELGDRRIAICRELTKIHEEVLRCQISDAIAHFIETEPLGEFTVIIAGAAQVEETWSRTQLEQEIRAGLRAGKRIPDLSKDLSEKSGWNRKEIYGLVGEIKSAE